MSSDATDGSQQVPWRSYNSRTGVGKTCSDYRAQNLCKLCDHQIHYFAAPSYHSMPGGTGWSPEWGTPGDAQYSNGGLTAVDACCACGGGDRALADLSTCTAFSDGCDKIEECTSEQASFMFGGAFVLIMIATAFFVWKANEGRKKRKEAAAAQQAEAAAAAADGPVVAAAVPGAPGLVVNPLNAATAVAAPVAQPGATTMMQVQVPQGSGPGQPMLVNTPGGQMQVIVPAGIMPGMAFQVSVPAAAPVAVATATAVPATVVATAVATPAAVATAPTAVVTAPTAPVLASASPATSTTGAD
jgi:hypothetical protein